MKPREQALDFPTTPVTPQDAAVLRRGFASPGIVRRNQLHSEALANLHIQRGHYRARSPIKRSGVSARKRRLMVDSTSFVS